MKINVYGKMSYFNNNKFRNTMNYNREVFHLFYILNKENNNNKYNNNLVDMSCTSMGLNVLYNAVRNIFQLDGYRNILSQFGNLLISHPNPKYYYNPVLTIPDKYSYNDSFRQEIVKYDFYTNLSLNIASSPTVQLCYKSIIANGNWKFKFNKNKTEIGKFYTDKGDQISIPIMTCNDSNLILKSYFSKKLNCAFVDLPYENEEYSMLIIKPENYLNRDQLIDFCKKNFSPQKEEDSQPILDFYYKRDNYVKYKYFKMPKFHIQSKYQLDKEELLGCRRNYYENLIPLFGGPKNPPDFSPISKELASNEEVTLSLDTEFTCDENGVSPPSPAEMGEDKEFIENEDKIYEYNAEEDIKVTVAKPPLLIKNNFIFAIMRTNDVRIIALGTFTGR